MQITGDIKMHCYGIEYKNHKKCSVCNLAKWCKDAEDLPYDRRGGIDIEVVARQIKFSTPPTIPGMKKSPWNRKEYSRNDLLEIIAFMLSMDEHTLLLLDEKIRDPDISFSELARKRQVSRQAVHKQILKKCRQIPELEVILRNRRNKTQKNQQTTFMEAVCQIRRKMSEKKSQQPSKSLKSSGRLTCLTQNLDLSRMSIFKGVKSSNRAWKSRRNNLQKL
jgi:predicted DNA-binding protein YlxM (UPF0122 family)